MRFASLGLRSRLIGLVLLGALPLAVLLVDSALRVLHDADRLPWHDLAIIAITALCGVLAAWLAAEWLVLRGMRRLTALALAAGDGVSQPPEEAPDLPGEIGVVARAFHAMWCGHVAREALVVESRRKLDAVTANVPGILYQVWRHADGTVSYPFFSNYIDAICGASPRQVALAPSLLFERLSFRDAAARERVTSPPPGDATAWREEVGYVTPLGRSGWLNIQATVRPAPDGGAIWDCIAMDVTEAKGLEEKLRATELRLTDAIESISEGFVLWDVADRLVMCNSRYREIYALTGDAFSPGITFKAALRAGVEQGQYGDIEDPEGWLASIAEVRRAPDAIIEHHLGDGSWVQATDRRTADGGMVGIHTEITELKIKEFELREARDRLEEQARELVGLAENYAWAKGEAEEANRAKSEFLTGMSHELRTPLNAILGFSQLIGSVDFGAESLDRFRSYAGNIHASGEHLLSLINDLLDLSKVEAGKMELQEEDVDLSDLLRAVETMMRERVMKAGIMFAVRPPEHEIVVRADPLKLKQSLINLLSNALKFTPQGGTISVLLEDGTDGVSIAVADTGIGIKPEDLPKVFDKFGQIDGSLSRRHRGTGLGMPLTKTFVEMHGGSIELESVVGRGTRVTMRLPRERRLALAS